MATDNSQKDWDSSAPFHRINSRYYDTSMTKQGDGKGYDCGCRKPFDFSGTLGPVKAEMVRMLPAWVLINNQELQEVEGTLARSFQTWTDVPMTQWHLWYDWNFHVEPMTGYAYVRGKGNQQAGANAVVQGASIELEWDTGAFGTIPNPMFEADWAWPMAGQHLWAAGRWIYDCGHANNDLMRSELHPVRAVATARWEAAKFAANNTTVLWPPQESQTIAADTLFVPAIQFMFFASRFGGYVNYPELKDWNRNYEFIVDLPRVRIGGTTVEIGKEWNYPLNTVVVKSSKLLCSFNFQPFAIPMKTHNTSQQKPTVTYDPANPDQVKISIPLTQLAAGTEGYGVIVSLGWVDNENTLARHVVHCTLTMNDITVVNAKTGTLTFRWGANGRWKSQKFGNVTNGQVLKLDARQKSVDFWLTKDLAGGDGDDLFINMHGMAEDRVGAYMELPPLNRTFLTENLKSAVTWDDIIRANADLIETMAERIYSKLFLTLNQGNEALGIADLHFRVRTQTGTQQIQGRTMTELPGLAELVWASGNDYTSSVTIQYDPQTVP